MSCKIQKSYEGRDVKEIERNGERFRIISAKTCKGKYSISAKYNDIFIEEELFNKNNDIIWNEAIDIIFLYRELLQKMLDAGVPSKSATPKAKKEAFERVQAQYIDRIGKSEYIKLFPMVDKSKAKTTKQRKNAQVREVKSKIGEIKKLTKSLELPPEVTQPNDDIVTQINNAIQDDESLEALKDTRDIDALKVEKAKIELPQVELDINIGVEVSESDVSKATSKEPEVKNETSKVYEKPYYEKAAEKIIEFDDDLESFFADNNDLF